MCDEDEYLCMAEWPTPVSRWALKVQTTLRFCKAALFKAGRHLDGSSRRSLSFAYKTRGAESMVVFQSMTDGR